MEVTQKAVIFDTPKPLADVIATMPSPDTALDWGKQTFGHGLVKAMIMLASQESEHYRYAVAVSLGLAQVLYEPVQNSVVEREHFLPCVQRESLIGHYDGLDVHVIQQEPETLDETVMLLILDDQHNVAGYINSLIRPAQDHVVTMMKPVK